MAAGAAKSLGPGAGRKPKSPVYPAERSGSGRLREPVRAEPPVGGPAAWGTLFSLHGGFGGEFWRAALLPAAPAPGGVGDSAPPAKRWISGRRGKPFQQIFFGIVSDRFRRNLRCFQYPF